MTHPEAWRTDLSLPDDLLGAPDWMPSDAVLAAAPDCLPAWNSPELLPPPLPVQPRARGTTKA